MTDTTTKSWDQMQQEIRENQERAMKQSAPRYRWLARDLRHSADELDTFAEAVREWGDTDPLSPRAALGLIQKGEHHAWKAGHLIGSKQIGPNTRSSLANDAGIALGGYSGPGYTGVAYALMYALGEDEKVRTGEYNKTERRQSRTAVIASSLRVLAAGYRVTAQIADEVAEARERGAWRAIG